MDDDTSRSRPRPSPRPTSSPPPGVPPVGDTRPRAVFVPDRRYTAVAAGGALGAVLGTVLAPDPGGRLLLGLAAALLLAYVVTDLVFSPRLVADADGLVVNAPLHRVRLGWADVVAVRADTRMRHGLRSTTLEIDADEVLMVFSRRALGTEPVDAADLIEAFRPR